MKRISVLMIGLLLGTTAFAQTAGLKRVYDEQRDPMAQIDSAVAVAQRNNRFVICQLGGNWCPWCLKFADFIEKDSTISATIEKSFVYTHVNYPTRGTQTTAQQKALIERLHNAGRFGFPCLVVLDGKGRLMHIQDSSFLEEGQSYNHDAVLRFLKGWTPEAVR